MDDACAAHVLDFVEVCGKAYPVRSVTYMPVIGVLDTVDMRDTIGCALDAALLVQSAYQDDRNRHRAVAVRVEQDQDREHMQLDVTYDLSRECLVYCPTGWLCADDQGMHFAPHPDDSEIMMYMEPSMPCPVSTWARYYWFCTAMPLCAENGAGSGGDGGGHGGGPRWLDIVYLPEFAKSRLNAPFLSDGVLYNNKFPIRPLKVKGPQCDGQQCGLTWCQRHWVSKPVFVEPLNDHVTVWCATPFPDTHIAAWPRDFSICGRMYADLWTPSCGPCGPCGCPDLTGVPSGALAGPHRAGVLINESTDDTVWTLPTGSIVFKTEAWVCTDAKDVPHEIGPMQAVVLTSAVLERRHGRVNTIVFDNRTARDLMAVVDKDNDVKVIHRLTDLETEVADWLTTDLRSWNHRIRF
jgi:hypothetical protein